MITFPARQGLSISSGLFVSSVSIPEPTPANISCNVMTFPGFQYEIPRPGVSLVKAWEINLVFNLVLAWKFRQIE